MFISGHFHVLGMRNTTEEATFPVLQSKHSSGKCAKLDTVAPRNTGNHPRRLLCYCWFGSHIFVSCSLRAFRWWWMALSTQHQTRGCSNIRSFLQWTAPVARSFCGGCTCHHLHILVTAPLCCDLKSRATSAQSRWSRSARVDSGRSLHFRREPESIF